MQSNIQIDTLLAALLFATIFVFGWRLHRARTPRAVLSLGAGATASYVFVRMLPELGEAQTAFVAASAGRALPAPEVRVYTAALSWSCRRRKMGASGRSCLALRHRRSCCF